MLKAFLFVNFKTLNTRFVQGETEEQTVLKILRSVYWGMKKILQINRNTDKLFIEIEDQKRGLNKGRIESKTTV